MASVRTWALAAATVVTSTWGCAQIIGADFDKPFETSAGAGAGSASGAGGGDACGDGKCAAGTESPATCPKDCPKDCGDGKCGTGEDKCKCPADCGSATGDGECNCGEVCGTDADCSPCCGDKSCDQGEPGGSCPQDCMAGCGDMNCDGGAGEDKCSCPVDCGGSPKNDGDCNCGEVCGPGTADCSPCPGDGICNGQETNCDTPQDCGPQPNDGCCDLSEDKCNEPACADKCGDGCCSAGETNASCPNDCPADCPNGTCGPGENCQSCAVDCGCAGGMTCVGGACKFVDGTPCSTDVECANGHCVDSFCCDSACPGACFSCSATKKGVGANGVCGPVLVGLDPDNECNPGFCNGVNACQCADGGKNGSETDIDCGGPACNKCADGKTCLGAGDCASTFCVDGVCCNEGCGGTCRACSAVKKGQGTNGVCGPIKVNEDPDDECNPGVCNGSQQCQCFDGTKNGSESDIDCGGSDCDQCPSCKTCNGDADCVSGLCNSCGWCCCDGSCQCPCTSPDTPIATPTGERRIADLEPGDLVYSVDAGTVVAVPVLRKNRIPVQNHHVIRVVLDTGAVLEITPGHPTADGRTFADLKRGAALGGAGIVDVQLVPYAHAETFDILPASSTGTYFAGGALIASTLHAPVNVAP